MASFPATLRRMVEDGYLSYAGGVLMFGPAALEPELAREVRRRNKDSGAAPIRGTSGPFRRRVLDARRGGTHSAIGFHTGYFPRGSGNSEMDEAVRSRAEAAAADAAGQGTDAAADHLNDAYGDGDGDPEDPEEPADD